MPDAKRAAVDLDTAPPAEELLAAAREGLSLVAYRAKTTGALPPDEGDEDRLEKAEGVEVDKVFKAFGGRVWNLSQARAAKQTPGLGDRFVIFPDRVSFWWEVKRQVGGRISDAQREFNEMCEGAEGSKHYFGGRKEAEALVIVLGLAVRDERSGALEPVRRP
jgi:hypothetical protein